MTNGKKVAIGVSGTVSSAIIVFMLTLWWGHFEATAQTARSNAETEEIQETLVKVVDRLSKIHESGDAAKKQTVRMCEAGQISDCNVCDNVDVFSAKGCKYPHELEDE